jgi:hypothetical protein
MIAALERLAQQADDAWILGTLGEAYLCIGDHENAATYYGAYAQHKNIDAFALSGTVRQLEEVWQRKANDKGAGAIVTGLKASLAQRENGHVRLDATERLVISKGDATSCQAYFETKTADGKFIKFDFLRRIVLCASAVAAIQESAGTSVDTIGTGFLVRGSDFGANLPDDKSYVLTNAHVLWDRNRGRGLGAHRN